MINFLGPTLSAYAKNILNASYDLNLSIETKEKGIQIPYGRKGIILLQLLKTQHLELLMVILPLISWRSAMGIIFMQD